MAEDIDDNEPKEEQFNASDPVQVAAKRRAAGKKSKADEGIVHTVMSTKAGREWMYSLLASCHCFGTSFTGEALSMAFKEGERNIGNMLISSIMKTSPDNFIEMLKEHRK
jgi:hypothetical protein